MSKIVIEVKGEIELTYDENSKEFNEALKSYRECIQERATKEDMLKHVAFYINRCGTHGMVEGVGFVGVNGIKPNQEPYSGIMVGEGYDDMEFEIQ